MGKRISFGTIIIIIVALAKFANYSQKTNFQAQTNTGGSISCSDKEVASYFEKANSIWDDFDYDEESAHRSYLSIKKISYPPCLKKLNDLSSYFFYNSWHAAQEYNKGNQSNADFFIRNAEKNFAEMENEMERLGREYGWEQ